MRQNQKKAKRLQQVRGKVLRTNQNLQQVKPSLKSKNAVSILMATVMGCTGAFAVQQSSIASVTSEGQNLNNLTVGTNTNVQNSLSGNTVLSNTNSGYYSSNGLGTSYDSTAAENNFVAVKNAENAAAQNIQSNIESCATDGIGKVVQDNLNLQMTVWGRPIDINKMFSPSSQGGCFADIGKIIDLSVTIPSLDVIIDAAQKMVIDYATKKACDAMKSASSELVGPLNDVIGEINKAGQYTDVSGALGGVLNKELGKIDEGLVLPSSAFEGGTKYPVNGGTPGFNPNASRSGGSEIQNGTNTANSTNDGSSSVTQTIKDFFS